MACVQPATQANKLTKILLKLVKKWYALRANNFDKEILISA
jgi:hypothetical protein